MTATVAQTPIYVMSIGDMVQDSTNGNIGLIYEIDIYMRNNSIRVRWPSGAESWYPNACNCPLVYLGPQPSPIPATTSGGAT
jgi:hypothetical protein